ncbi:MAG: hypothetical protein Q4A51_01855 [Lachnospiraceae bacterium]|nr:hypothetical protein [Lachnospiraceae bacterium]
MERHARREGQLNTRKTTDTKRMTSVDRLFLSNDVDKYIDVNLYEEDFYSQTTDISSYFTSKKPNKENAQLFQDPVFFTLYEEKKEEFYPAEDTAFLYEEENQTRKHTSDRSHAAKKPVTKKKEKKVLSKEEKKKRRVIISLILTIFLGIALIVGYILAGKYSNSKTYVIKRDKTAPIATVTDYTIFSYETLAPEDIISDIQDETAVTVNQLDEIDYSLDGEQIIRFELVDEANNSTVLEAKVTVIHDVTAPTIACEPLIRVTTGQTVAYKSFVVIHDDYDEDPDITIDNSQVDLSREGRYPLSYTATDKSGNSNTKYCEIEVSASNGYVADEDVWALVDATLSYIITDDMDDIHKVWAVYEYVRNIPYTLTDYSYDYMYEGYKILHDNRGDCFGSYSASKLLLDRLGIDNIPIETSSNGRHYWNMVSLDKGQTWYHFDATQWTEWGYRPVMCMISSDELYRISEEHFGTHRYDASQYPATPAESMPVPDDIEDIYGYDY